MIGRTNTGGGGGGLNFKVVGNPQPSTPKDNTIWLNTDVKIPEWAMTPSNPFVVTSNNLYTSATNAGYLDPSGAIVNNSDAKYTNYIELPKDTLSVTITLGNQSTISPSHAIYDENKNLISTFLRTPGTSNKDIPSNAKYIRMSVLNSETAKLIASYQNDVEEGTVWFPTGTASVVEFDALKKNSIQVCPISAKQYISGAWVNVKAMSYQEGKWVAWSKHLYDHGDKCESVTGGWQEIRGGGTSVTWNADSVKLTAIGATERWVSICTKQKVDVTGYKTLYARISGIQFASGTDGKFCLGLAQNMISNYNDSAWLSKYERYSAHRSAVTGEILLPCDISTIEGEFFVQIVSHFGNGYVHEIYME